jgi:hypothetical protein
MRVYVAGPMTGHKAYNYEAFVDAARFLISLGHDAVIPFESNSRVWARYYGRPFDPYTDECDYGDSLLPQMIHEDLGELCRADAIALLPGWEKSRGAKVELLLAINLGKKILDATTGDELVIDADIEFRVARKAIIDAVAGHG